MSLVYHLYERLREWEEFGGRHLVQKLETTLLHVEKQIALCERTTFKIKRELKREIKIFLKNIYFLLFYFQPFNQNAQSTEVKKHAFSAEVKPIYSFYSFYDVFDPVIVS